MSDETALLPASSISEAGAPKPFDLAAHAAKLKATPKEQYAEARSTPEPEPDNQPGPEPEAEPSTGTGGTSNGDANHEESAREFVELYDLTQSYVFSFASGQKPEAYTLPNEAKKRAVHHLARGLEKMGGMEVPWWMGLTIALGPPTALNVMVAKEYRQQQEEAKAQQRAQERRGAQRGPGPVAPDSIFHRGEVINMQGAAPKERKQPGTCAVCGKPTKPGRSYCSQSCAGKGTAAKRRAKASDKA